MNAVARLRALFVRCGGLFRPEKHETEMNDELRSHLEALIDRNLAAGMSPDEARYAAQRAFGGLEQIKERARDQRRSLWGEHLLQDTRCALRGWQKSPRFAALVVLTLGLGIGATTAIFTVLNAIILRPLPIPAASDLVTIELPFLRAGASEPVSRRLYTEFRERGTTITDAFLVADARTRPLVIAAQDAGETDFVRVEPVTGNFFTALGLPAAAGRTLLPADDQPGRDAAVAVISHGFWQRRFGSDPTVVGRSVRIERAVFTIVGVAPSGFSGLHAGKRVEVWCPIRANALLDPERAAPGDDDYHGMALARLRPGVSREQAQTELAGIFQQDLERRKNGKVTGNPRWQQYFLGRTLALTPAATGINLGSSLRHQLSPMLMVLSAASAVVLLVACANVAGLLLARGAARHREFAVRAALGAGRGRLFGQLLQESMQLSLAGGLLGIAFAHGGTTLLAAYLPPEQNAVDLAPDARVLAFSLLAAGLTGLLSGLAPALCTSRVDLTAAFKNQAASIAGGRQRLNSLLVVGQVALSCTLLICAGLLGRTLQNLRTRDLGFPRDRLMLMTVDPGKVYAGAAGAGLYRRILDRLGNLPGVSSATMATGTFVGNGESGSFAIEGYAGSNASVLSASLMQVGPRFFATTGARLLQGRDFAPRDFTDAGPVATIVSDSLARTFFAGVDPIGRRFKQGRWTCEIIGVARDMQLETLREETRFGIYVPFTGRISDEVRPMTFQVRTAIVPSTLAPSLRNAVHELEPTARVTALRTMDAFIDEILLRERALAQLSGFFSGFSLLLASLGLYGFLSYGVIRRTREIGVRVALGAQLRDVIGLFLRQGLRLVLFGCFLGLVGALAAARWLGSLLYDVSPVDASSLAAATLLMLLTGVLASWWPARRAAKIDPMAALRAE